MLKGGEGCCYRMRLTFYAEDLFYAKDAVQGGNQGMSSSCGRDWSVNCVSLDCKIVYSS
jgi:hypothetical protein